MVNVWFAYFHSYFVFSDSMYNEEQLANSFGVKIKRSLPLLNITFLKTGREKLILCWCILDIHRTIKALSALNKRIYFVQNRGYISEYTPSVTNVDIGQSVSRIFPISIVFRFFFSMYNEQKVVKQFYCEN